MMPVLAWILALALGAGIVVLASGRPRTGAEALSLAGYAVPIGLLACALTVRLPSAVGYGHLPMSLWLWPALSLVVVLATLWIAARRGRPEPMAPARVPALIPVPASHRLWLALIVLLIAIRALWLFEEAWLRPLFGWDAWLAWSAKAKAWLLSGQAAPFVDGPAWLADAAGASRTSLAHHYPELLSWLQVWLSSPTGGWSEPAINIAWPALWLALVAGCYGQWRVLGVMPLTAGVGAYLLASLPLANVHAALPGYADLWVATVFVFALLSLLRWRERGERPQLWLALGLTALLPSLKLEGMVWATAVLALVFWFSLTGYPRLVRMLAAFASVLVLVLVSWLLGLPWLDLLVELVTGAGHGGSVFDVLTSTGSGLFTQDNWHLLWYLLPVVVIWRWRALRASTSLTGSGLLLLGGLSLLLALFVGTSAGRWAESFTAVNRLVLHLAPIGITLMVLLMRASPVDPDALRGSALRPGPDTPG